MYECIEVDRLFNPKWPLHEHWHCRAFFFLVTLAISINKQKYVINDSCTYQHNGTSH